jgi:hypothetical protein
MVARFFEVLDHFPEKWERGEDADLLPGRSFQLVCVGGCKDDERLFFGFDAVFLRRYEVE